MSTRIAAHGQILTYQKMSGQLVDAGNTVTLAHQLHRLEVAGMAAGLSKFSGTQNPPARLQSEIAVTQYSSHWLSDKGAKTASARIVA